MFPGMMLKKSEERRLDYCHETVTYYSQYDSYFLQNTSISHGLRNDTDVALDIGISLTFTVFDV